jgi:hypothetical protein
MAEKSKENKTVETQAPKAPKSRSPNYPAISLQEAIEKASIFFNKQPRHAAGVEVLAGFWGYKPKSSTFMVILAALRSFGLLEDVPNGAHRLVKLTPRALDIVADYKPGEPQHGDAIKKAALTPKIHNELWVRYGPDLPSADELRRYLVRERGFTDKAVGEFIDEYKQTIAFAKLTKDDKIVPAGEGVAEQDQEEAKHDSPVKLRRRAMQAGTKEDVFTLDEGQVVLQWPEQLSKESFDDFESWLQLVIRKAKRSIVDQSEAKPLSAKPMLDSAHRAEEED